MRVPARFSVRNSELPASFWYLWVGTVINRLGGFAVPFLMLYLTARLSMAPASAALLASVLGAGSFVAQLTGGELADRLGRRPVMMLSFFIAPIAMVALGLTHETVLLVIAMFVLGFFTDLYRPAVNAAIADLVPAERRTRAYGYIYWAVNLGAALAPVIAGLLANYDYFLLFLGDALTTAVFGLIVLTRVPETQAAEIAAAARTPTRARVGQAHRIQIERQGKANSSLSTREIDTWCRPDAAAEGLLRQAIARLNLSARAYHRVLKLARTIADLARSEAIAVTHVAEAIQYRKLDRTI